MNWFLQKVYNLLCSKITAIFVVKHATIFPHQRTSLKYVQKEDLQ